MSRSYKIIHKAEIQLLYERVTNLNNILYMYEHNRAKCFSQIRNLISENDIIRCIQLIDKIKEHRYNKIKARQINNFEWLVNKNSGYMYDFTRHNNGASFDNSSRQFSLDRHPQNNLFSQSISSTTITPPTAPTTPAPTILWVISNPEPFNTSKQMWVINLANSPLHQHKNHFWQEDLILPLFQSTPLRRPTLQQLKRPVPDSPLGRQKT